MNIGYILDEGFIVPVTVSIYSLLHNNRDVDEIKLFILDDGITGDSREKLTKMINAFNRKACFVDVSEVRTLLSKTTSYNWNGSYSTYIRLMLNTLLPDMDDVIIMIDGDTIIDGSISELGEIDLNGNPCAMALEAMPYSYHKYSGLGDGELINGGVLVIDLKKWREAYVEQKVLSFLIEVREKNMLTDEDVISEILKGKIVRIQPRYNYLTQYYLYSNPFYYHYFGWDKLYQQKAFYSLKELKEAGEKAVIYHCIDTFTNRPWHKNNFHPYAKMFDKYLKQTPWSGYVKTKRQMSLRATIEYILRRCLPRQMSKFLYATAVKLYYGVGAKRYYA